MPLETTAFDMIDYLDDADDIAVFLEVVLETGDPTYIANALGKIARSPGLAPVAAAAGMTLAELAAMLSDDGQRRFDALIVLTNALGTRLKPVPNAALAA